MLEPDPSRSTAQDDNIPRRRARVHRHAPRRRGYVPLWTALVIATIVIVALSVWTIHSMSSETSDGRQTIVFWGAQQLGEDIYAVVNQFENLPENSTPTASRNTRSSWGRRRRRILLRINSGCSARSRAMCRRMSSGSIDSPSANGRRGMHWRISSLTSTRQKKDDPHCLDLERVLRLGDQGDELLATRNATTSRGFSAFHWTSICACLFCNSNLLRQEGLIDPKTNKPQPPRTWEELREYANRADPLQTRRRQDQRNRAAGIRAEFWKLAGSTCICSRPAETR